MKLTKPNVFQNLLDNLGQKIKKKNNLIRFYIFEIKKNKSNLIALIIQVIKSSKNSPTKYSLIKAFRKSID